MFWGQITGFGEGNSAFEYRENDKVSVSILDQMYGPLNLEIDVYGKAYKELALISGSTERVLRFSYDWRQSNVKSSEDFASWLCKPDVRSLIKDRPVVIVAHSMGGLVLRHWLKHRYDGPCKGDTEKVSDWINIKKVVLAGTPNYGAPKALLTFSRGQTLFIDQERDSLLWRALKWMDMTLLSNNLNTYGIRYPSAYELLPIANTNDCFRSPDWRQANSVEFYTQNGIVSENIDLFDAGNWGIFGWPVQLKGAEREKFLKNELPGLLRGAKDFLCDMANYDIDSNGFDVIRLAGMAQKTICKIQFRPPGYAGAVDYCKGDGTVPLWIASDLYRAKPGGPKNSASHASQLSSEEFSVLVQELAQQKLANLATKAATSEGSADAAANMFAKLKYIPQGELDTLDRLIETTNTKARTVADRVVEKLNISADEDLFRAAKAEQDAGNRLTQWMTYATLGDAEPRFRAWALNNAAHIQLESMKFDQAFDLSKRAIEFANKAEALDPKLGPEMKGLRSKAALTAAVSASKLGKEEDAASYRAVAIQNGSRKATRLPQPKS